MSWERDYLDLVAMLSGVLVVGWAIAATTAAKAQQCIAIAIVKQGRAREVDWW